MSKKLEHLHHKVETLTQMSKLDIETLESEPHLFENEGAPHSPKPRLNFHKVVGRKVLTNGGDERHTKTLNQKQNKKCSPKIPFKTPPSMSPHVVKHCTAKQMMQNK